MQQPPNEGQPRPPYSPPPGQQYGPPPQYPPQPSYPVGPPPRRRRRVWPWIVLGVLAVVVLGCIGVVAIATSASKTTLNTLATTVATSLPTSAKTQSASTPAGSQKWTTTHTFTGNGTKKTAIFSVPADWKLLWSCSGQDIGGVTADGLLAVSIYGDDNSIVEAGAVNATCKAGSAKTTGETEEHQSGNIYLSVNATGEWSVQVQELK